MSAVLYPEPSVLAEQAPPLPDFATLDEAEPQRSRIRRRLIGAAVVAGIATALIVAAALIGGSRSPAAASHEGFAELFVRTYLSQAGEGNESAVASFLGYEPDLSGMQPGTWYVTQAVAISSTPLAGARWEVVVATDLLGSVTGGYVPVGVRYYVVELTAVDGRLLATRLPAAVPPPVGVQPTEVVPATVTPDEGPLTQAVSSYLSWYLAGADGPYESERAMPSLFRSVSIRSMTIPEPPDGPATIDVVVSAVDDGGRTSVVSARVRVAQERGMWVAGPDL